VSPHARIVSRNVSPGKAMFASPRADVDEPLQLACPFEAFSMHPSD
jgi:hypothetical protein